MWRSSEINGLQVRAAAAWQSYDRIAEPYERLWAPRFERAARHLLALIPLTPGARLLDVGTGTGWLAIALARTFPQASITGIDIFEPAMRLARHNVTTEALSDRVSIVGQDITTMDAADQFDAVWLPLPFLPKAIVPTAIASAAKSLRPGGWLLPGTFAGPPDQLGRILTDLRIRRSGGHPWTPDDITTMMTDAGLTEARHVPRTWPAPLELLAAQHPVG